MRKIACITGFNAFLATAIILSGATAAHATVVTSLTGGTVYQQTELNYFGSGPQVVAPGITWTASSADGVYGYTEGYGFGDNGEWTGDPAMAGTDDFFTSMTFTFADPVSAVGGLLNYTPDTNFGDTFTIAVYNQNGDLIESYNPSFSVTSNDGGQFYGFQETSADIGSFVVSGDESGLRNFTVGSSAITATPEPGSFFLLGTGFAGMFARRFRRS